MKTYVLFADWDPIYFDTMKKAKDWVFKGSFVDQALSGMYGDDYRDDAEIAFYSVKEYDDFDSDDDVYPYYMFHLKDVLDYRGLPPRPSSWSLEFRPEWYEGPQKKRKAKRIFR